MKDCLDKDYNEKASCDCKTDIDLTEAIASSKTLLLFCGRGVDAQFTSDTSPAVNVGFVTVDTTDLCRALVKIKFSSVVNLSSELANPVAQIVFTLSRTCEDSGTLLLNTWTYEASLLTDNAVPLVFNTSFTFNFCDRLSCSRCCDYCVEASVGSLTNAVVLVNDVNIQAIAQ